MDIEIYIASKTKYANIWKTLKLKKGYKIISSWINEADEGETKSKKESSFRFLEECRRCDWLILWCQPKDLLKGALIEVGAALTSGSVVLQVGSCESISEFFACHSNYKKFESMDKALKFIYEYN